jgi:uncharacterized membrane protein YoaK (UPF0700 family)
MTSKSRFLALGFVIGATIGAAMAGATHQPAVWLPLGAGIGLAIGVAVRDRKSNEQPRAKS